MSRIARRGLDAGVEQVNFRIGHVFSWLRQPCFQASPAVRASRHAAHSHPWGTARHQVAPRHTVRPSASLRTKAWPAARDTDPVSLAQNRVMWNNLGSCTTKSRWACGLDKNKTGPARVHNPVRHCPPSAEGKYAGKGGSVSTEKKGSGVRGSGLEKNQGRKGTRKREH